MENDFLKNGWINERMSLIERRGISRLDLVYDDGEWGKTASE
jgi:hypothetical protein